ncbi:MAG: tRNA uridine-5-carboxymethylaminomethyl(34) synthesis enzyme MnmG [Ruminococcaceae bacterium]|nr:tRNA uridine-5-carboxymethylaminomethyl(34) synthesis enzyme MnmG [Oscillospiraceae bacterium]
MDLYTAGEYDVAVIGAGHAGCEAALASARLGMKTIIFAINLDSIANMPCNPCIGGTAKGHLVREIDALGGEMGKNTDKTFIQSRILNKGKGPAVYSLRAQADRRKYQEEMKKVLENQPNLDIKQAEIIDIEFDEDNNVKSVVTHLGAKFLTKAAIIATGTFLKGKVIVGDVSYSSGPDGIFPANRLSDSLRNNKIDLMRFKTGTPARINANSVDFTKMEVQSGDEDITPFSFETENVGENKVDCYLTYTNKETHKIIMDNLHRSPLYSGQIEGVGPRYCPSIEDKIVRFKDKERHQIFVEPMGIDTAEMYVQGFSSSLPEDVQMQMIRTLPGLENVKVMRTAYAIEYDCVDATNLYATLEFKDFPGLYGAGQFNGSSGYEEAAAQGLIAGINAALKIKGKEPFILDRSQAYIGTLIDDLTVKGTNEPYRMLTSRSEYRLLLRQDNADLRLTPLGYEIGLISEERYQKFLAKKKAIEDEIERAKKTVIAPKEEVNDLLEKYNSTKIKSGVKLSELVKRPELDYKILKPIDKTRPELDKYVEEQAYIQLKYEGYIKKQVEQVEQFKKLEKKKIPDNIEYATIHGLRLEARQKLDKIRPHSIGQASRISGVSPSDINVLLIYIQTL